MADTTALVNHGARTTPSFPCDLVADLDVATWGRATLAALLAGRQSRAAGAMSHPPVSIEAWPGSDPSPMLATTLAYVRAGGGAA